MSCPEANPFSASLVGRTQVSGPREEEVRRLHAKLNPEAVARVGFSLTDAERTALLNRCEAIHDIISAAPPYTGALDG